MKAQPYRDELAAVKKSLTATCAELAAELKTAGKPIEAVRVEEAAAFLAASFRSLNRTLDLAEARRRF